METNKTQAVLYMYQLFTTRGYLSKKDYLSSIETSDISFKRYIAELRAFFANFDPTHDIHYSRKNDVYFLIKNVSPRH